MGISKEEWHASIKAEEQVIAAHATSTVTITTTTVTAAVATASTLSASDR